MHRGARRSDNEVCREGTDKGVNEGRECFAYDSTTTFHQGSNTNYFDIEIIRAGTNDKDSIGVKPFKEVLLYRFNGCSYEKGPVALFSDDRLFCIQIAAFAKYQSASELAKKLSNIGYPSYCDFRKPNKGKSFSQVKILWTEIIIEKSTN